ncbi:MAG: metalloregulator ArsR/SmtB family transcription factor [Planctomycetes bacterium]|nr:metalloregulator ArsR/SmtB family transcription factor [Planctomycetota bacterium]
MVKSSFPELSEQVQRDLLQIFKLVSDETRFRILVCLAKNGEQDVTSMCQLLGHSQPAISHHLGLLRIAGLIQMRRDGKHNFYSVQKRRFSGLLRSIFGDEDADQEPTEFRFDGFVVSYST